MPFQKIGQCSEAVIKESSWSEVALAEELSEQEEFTACCFGFSALVLECQQEENQNYYIKACRVDSHNH